jgi:hypothetical protein
MFYIRKITSRCTIRRDKKKGSTCGQRLNCRGGRRPRWRGRAGCRCRWPASSAGRAALASVHAAAGAAAAVSLGAVWRTPRARGRRGRECVRCWEAAGRGLDYSYGLWKKSCNRKHIGATAKLPTLKSMTSNWLSFDQRLLTKLQKFGWTFGLKSRKNLFYSINNPLCRFDSPKKNHGWLRNNTS